MITQRNTPLLHRKEFQMMTPAPVNTAAGSFVIAPDSGNFNNALFVSSAALMYLYNHDEDGWLLAPAAGLAGTFGAGACGVFHPWSSNYTANGGSTTSVTVNAASFNISGRVVGQTIEFISAGASSGFRTTVASIMTNAGYGTITLYLTDPAPSAILNTHTFRTTTGRFYVMNAGTVAANIYKVLDVATGAWTGLTSLGLPATWGTDGKMVTAYNFGEIFASGTATAGAASTLTNGVKTWTTNQWTNYMVRITGGTGIGQTRVIASNTGTVLTVSSAWTTIPDITSTYEITANEDWIYLMGNNSVTMYRYSISTNTWTTLAPTVARSGAPSTGMSGNAIGVTGDALWANESAILDGRYILSVRGGASISIDRFDIAGGTSGAGAWAVISMPGSETFNTGSSAFPMGEFLYIRKEATNRFFKYSIVDNALRPFNTNTYTDGAALVGHKIWVKKLPGTDIRWLYSLQNTGPALHRIMIF